MGGSRTVQNSMIFSALRSLYSSPRVHVHGSPQTSTQPSSYSSSALQASPLLPSSISNSSKEHLFTGLSFGTVLMKKRLEKIDILIAQFTFGFKSPKCAKTMNIQLTVHKGRGREL